MQKIEISSKTIVFTVFFLILLDVLWQTRELIYSLFLAFIFMSSLKPAVNFLTRKKIPRSLAIVSLFIVTISLLILIISVVLPPVIQQTISFFISLPNFATKTFPYLKNVINVNAFTNYLPNIGQNIIQVLTNVFSNILFIVSVIFFTFYLLVDESILRSLLDKFVNEKREQQILSLIERIQVRLGSWVWGQLILMTAIGVMSYIGLSLLGIRYALPLAIIAGLLEALPMIGPIFSAVPAFFVAAATSWFSGLTVIALYFIIQQLEGNVIVPIVMKKTVGINPIMTLIALTIGGKLGGIIGAFLAVPVSLIIEVLLAEFLHEKKVISKPPQI